VTPFVDWSGLSNGELLDSAERTGFDLFIVADKNLRYQQNLSARRIAILELWTNHRPTFEKHFQEIQAAVARIKAGQYLILEEPQMSQF
jgi:hypothetical protein